MDLSAGHAAQFSSLLSDIDRIKTGKKKNGHQIQSRLFGHLLLQIMWPFYLIYIYFLNVYLHI